MTLAQCVSYENRIHNFKQYTFLAVNNGDNHIYVV